MAEGLSAAELAVAAALFAFAVAAFLLTLPPTARAGVPAAALTLFTLLVGSYLASGIRALPRAVAAAIDRAAVRALAGPAVILAACTTYAAVSHLDVARSAASFAVYLFAPTLVAGWRAMSIERPPARALAAVALLWLPIEFRLLPAIPLPAPDGYDASRFAGLVAGLYLFLVARPLDGVGFTYLLRSREVALAIGAFLLYAVVALPIGLGTGFLAWHPRLGVAQALSPLLIYLVTALPEEFLFRGLLQNLFTRWLGARPGLIIASVIFGLAHLPDPRYVLLAAVAGVAYGWVYQRTGKITASAITHALVDAAWGLLWG